MTQLVLSLFPGIGMLDAAFELEGFVVVRGPDLLWGGDVRRFHPPPGRFDGIIAGPPCQAFSRLAHLVRANGHTVASNLIPEFERVIAEAEPPWFVMENVEGAPEPSVSGYLTRSAVINNRDLAGEQNRVRRFTMGARSSVRLSAFGVTIAEEILRSPIAGSWSHAVTASGGAARSGVPVAIGGSGKRKPTRTPDMRTESSLREAVRLQGLPDDFAMPGFTVRGAIRAVGNGVPIPMGRAVARAARAALGLPMVSAAPDARPAVGAEP